MKTYRTILALSLIASSILRAQVVPDGTTNTLSNVTNNITGDVTVGTNGSSTLLVLSNNALLTNSANGNVGLNATAKSNEVRLVSPTARWFMGNNLFVGNNGSFSRLIVSNGAAVRDNTGFVGPNAASSNNFAIVTGTGSVWSNANVFYLGFSGAGNQLVVSNGGVLRANSASLGVNSSSSSNLALVTGSGSLWTNAASLQFNGGPGNQLIVSAGGSVRSRIGALGVSVSSSNNVAVVTGSGSSWANTAELYVGHNSAGNQLTVSAGGKLQNGVGFVGANATASNNLALITGGGSAWTNTVELNIGAFSSNNRMIVSNGATVFAATNGLIGPTANGKANSVVVTDAGSRWIVGNSLFVGSNGALSRLEINNGALVESERGTIGQNSSSSNNVVTVTGSGSIWTNRDGLNIGAGASGNRIEVSDGALLTTPSSADIGRDFGANSNSVVIAGAGSRWLLGDGIIVGGSGSGNRLVASNAAAIVTQSHSYIGQDLPSTSNEAVITGAGTAWISDGWRILVGNDGHNSRLLLSDGAAFRGDGITLGDFASSSNNLAVVTDVGSTCTNLGELIVGNRGRGNNLVVSNGATVFVGGHASIGRNTNANGNTSVVTGPGTSWLLNTNLYVGSNGAFNRLIISDGARVQNNAAFVGMNASSASNVVVVQDSGSIWTNAGDLYIGYSGGGNQLVVSNTGVVQNANGYIGYQSSSNVALVTGAGSVWSNAGFIFIGGYNPGNQLVVSNGGVVRNNAGVVGFIAGSSNNSVIVTGPGSVWATTFNLSFGSGGAGNQVSVTNGGVMSVGNGLFLGTDINSTNNRVVVDGGTLLVTNSLQGNKYDIRRGTNVFNAGLIELDLLLLTNVAGRFELNGGTLAARNSTVDNGQTFFVGNGTSAATFKLAGNGTHSFANQLFVGNNAMLTGNGSISGPLVLAGGGTVAPGSPIGKISLSLSPSLLGAVVMEISKNGAALTNDQIQISAPLTYGGSLVVSNLGPTALAAGDRFQLFNATAYADSFITVTLPPLDSGLDWTNRLSVDGSIEVIAVSQPTFTSVGVSGTNVIFSGTNGAPHAPYAVLTATNVTTPAANWQSLVTNQFGAGGQFSFTNGVNPNEPKRFFRLRSP